MSRGKDREIVGLSVHMNKTVHHTYLSNYKQSFMFASADIDVCNGLTLDNNYLLQQLQNVIKSFNCQCGDNNIIKNVTPQVFLPSSEACK